MVSLDEENRFFRQQRTSESSSTSSDSGIKLTPDNYSDGICFYPPSPGPVEFYTYHYSLKAEPMTHFISEVSLYPKQSNRKHISAIIHFPEFNNNGKSQTLYKDALYFVPHQEHKPQTTSKRIVLESKTKETFRSEIRCLPKQPVRIYSSSVSFSPKNTAIVTTIDEMEF